MSTGEGARDEIRERVISNILEKCSGELRVGIYGAKFCDVCGELGTYRGMWGAVGSHRFGVFVAIDHAHGLSEDELKRLGRRSWCYCQLCGTQKDGGRGLCDPCRAQLQAADPQLDETEVLRDLSRRRFLELEMTDDEDLREWDLQMEAFRLELDELGADGAERLRVKAAGPRRWREALRRLSEIHGKDYSDAG